MSGSRAIVLSLSVRDADVVRQQLVQMGEQGERALQRLDAAAQRSASGAGMPAFSRSTREAGENTGRFGQALGSAGYQIQDFAVQVQMGQNAMSAFGAQASQFLGAFGTGGAIAGAVLTVGLLAYQLLGVSEDGDAAAKAVENLGKAMEEAARDAERLAMMLARVEARFMSTIEAARQRRIRELNTDAAELGRLENDAMLRALNREAEGRTAANEAASFRGQLAPEYGLSFTEREAIQRRVTELEGIAASALADAERARRDATRFGFNRTRTEALIQGEVQGDANPNPGALERDPPARAERAERQGVDVRDAVRRSLDDLTRSYDEYSQAVNLSTAGIEGAASALAEYARHQQLLTALVNANIITEEQFATEVERTSERLRQQIEETERRAERTGQFANQLGFSFSSAFEEAILKGKSFSEVLKGLEQDIARVIIRSAITAPLGNAIAGGVQSLMPTFGGPRAEGGPVMGGMAYLVGERGPEIVVPRSSGTVIPNDRIGGPSITQNFNIDARGADASVVPRLRAEMVAIARASNAELLDSIQRGGSAARIVGRRA